MELTNDDLELMLVDRIEKIKSLNEQYDLENNGYVAFSGGKDSTILHYLLDIALPNNKIPRVFNNTGLEYQAIMKFVKALAKEDDRIIVLNSSINIPKMLEEKGYPFKSKEHSQHVHSFNVSGREINEIQRYLGVKERTRFSCPKVLLYQFEEQGKYNYSPNCCNELKKKPALRWAKEHNRSIALTGIRAYEKGTRSQANCLTFKGKKIAKINPLIVVPEPFNDWFLEKYNIKVCELYYPPYNLKRTGCKGCPFNKDIAKDLEMMKELLPNEYKQCNILWEKVYNEYKRLNYRIKTNKKEKENDN